MQNQAENSKDHGMSSELNDDLRTNGSWSFNENMLYVLFLQKNKIVMQSKKKRK